MRYIKELFDEKVIAETLSDSIKVNDDGCVFDKKIKVNIAALGDVGGTVLLGLRLMGGEYIESIGIFDLNEKVLRRYEREVNQVVFPDGRPMPHVEIIDDADVFNCDMFVFCATKAVPPIGADGDVRMAQFEANRGLVEMYARKAKERNYEGFFAVVSDPVDPLCKAAVLAGVNPSKIHGYGLGVMNARAVYYAKQEEKFSSYLTEGRAFGPHGQDLVIADSVVSYDDDNSRELTELAVNSNLVTRADGFKPYIAPAMSSAAISLLETIKGGWHYSSLYTGKVFLGCRNRNAGGCFEVENIPLDDKLFGRIKSACENLSEVI